MIHGRAMANRIQVLTTYVLPTIAIDGRSTKSNATIVRRGRFPPVTRVKAAVPCASGERQFFGFRPTTVDKSFMAPMKSTSRR